MGEDFRRINAFGIYLHIQNLAHIAKVRGLFIRKIEILVAHRIGVNILRVDSHFLDGARRNAPARHMVAELPFFGHGRLLPIDIHHAILNLQFVAMDGNTALDVVLALVNRTVSNRKQLMYNIMSRLSSKTGTQSGRIQIASVPHGQLIGSCQIRLGIHHLLKITHNRVVTTVLHLDDHRIAIRIVEDDRIVVFHRRGAGQTHVRKFNPTHVRRHGLGEHQRVVHEGQGKDRLRDALSVMVLAHRQIVAHHHGSLHRGGGDGVKLEDKRTHDEGRRHREDDGITPAASPRFLVFGQFRSGRVGLLFRQS